MVGIDNFDETMRDLIRLSPNLDTTELETFASDRKVWTPPPHPNGNGGFPVIRLNGLEIKALPTVCRLVTCTIGGQAKVVDAIETANVPVLAARTKSGVLAFGSDEQVRKAFEPYSIETFDLHSIEVRRLQNDSQERGLLRHALSLNRPGFVGGSEP